MGLNGFTEWLFSALLSWMQIIYNWFWSMLASGGQNEFMPWFSDNWLTIVIVLAVIGLVVDYTIYLMRWQPYHFWLTALRRAKGYVSRPFEKEQPRLRYAGYKRVLEDYDPNAEGDTRPRNSGSAAPRRTSRNAVAEDEHPRRQRDVVYEAAPANASVRRGSHHTARSVSPVETRETYAAMPRRDAENYAAVNMDNEGISTVVADVPQADIVNMPSPAVAAPVDTDAYIPESVAAPVSTQYARPAQPPVERENVAGAQPAQADIPAGMPMYGRVYQKPGQAFMPFGMGAQEEPGTIMRGVEPPVLDDRMPDGGEITVTLAPMYQPPVREAAPACQPPVREAAPAYQPPVQAAAPAYQPPVREAAPAYQPPVREAAPAYQPPVREAAPAYQPPVQAAAPAYQPPVQEATPAYQPPVEQQSPKKTAPAAHKQNVASYNATVRSHDADGDGRKTGSARQAASGNRNRSMSGENSRDIFGYTPRRRAAQPAQQAPQYAAQPAQQAPQYAAQPAQQAPQYAAQPVQQAPQYASQPAQQAPQYAAQPVQQAPQYAPAQQPSQYARPAQPRIISVQETGSTRERDFDDD